MSKPLVWITGAGGLIGSHLVRCAPQYAPGWEVSALTRERLDLADFNAVSSSFAAGTPSLVIHCAALSRVGDCHADPQLAERLNVAVTRHLCELAGNIPLLFFSTDLVFDGLKGNYVESDPVQPLTTYAETKVLAEEAVLRNSRNSVVRVSLNAGVSPSGNRSFTEDMRRAWERGQTLNLFTDEFRNPIPAAVTARAVWELVLLKRPGLYHLAGSERLSRWEIGQLLAKRWPQLPAKMHASSLKDYQGPKRPPDTSLNCSKLQALLSFQLPAFSDWLARNPQEKV